jgi:hypothetical protein
MKNKKRIKKLEYRLTELEQMLSATVIKPKYCCNKDYTHSHLVKVKKIG